MGRYLLRWFVRIGLFAAALLCLPAEPLLLWAVSDAPNSNIFWLTLAGILPLILATGFAIVAIWLEGRPKYVPFVALLLFSTIGGAIWEWYLAQPLHHPPALVQSNDLRGHTLYGQPDPVQSDRFTRILLQRFPVGTRVADLKAELKRERFSARGWSLRDGNYLQYSWQDTHCNYALRVYWRADTDAHVKSLRGEAPGPTCPAERNGQVRNSR